MPISKEQVEAVAKKLTPKQVAHVLRMAQPLTGRAAGRQRASRWGVSWLLLWPCFDDLHLPDFLRMRVLAQEARVQPVRPASLSQVRALPCQPAGIAQLEERLFCTQEAMGSIPVAGASFFPYIVFSWQCWWPFDRHTYVWPEATAVPVDC